MEKLISELESLKLSSAEFRTGSYNEGINTALRLLKSSLPTQQDKVVVPKVTGVMIDYFKREGFSLHESLNVHVNVPNIFSLVYKEFREWLTADDYATKEDIFARAWLDGYTVEKEQLYLIKCAEDRSSDDVYLEEALWRTKNRAWAESGGIYEAVWNPSKEQCITLNKEKAEHLASLVEGIAVPVEEDE